MATVNPKQKITLMVLGIVLVVVWTRALTSRPVYRQRLAPPSFHSSANRPVSTAPAVEKPSVLKWRRDPFALLGAISSEPLSTVQKTAVSPKSGGSSFRLEGIVWDSRRPTALINGTMVEVGSSIAGWKVIEIQENRVIISDGRTTKTIEL